jgi:hypothetical protein
MMKINNEKVKRVTGKVKGILKKMNKTYGGSILNLKDMTLSTKNKFELFCKNNRIDIEK